MPNVAPGCEGHRHPYLASPITPETLDEEIQSALWVAIDLDMLQGIPDNYPWEISDELGAEHCRNARRYADADPDTGLIRFAPQTLWLPKPHRMGLVVHEIGHLMCPECSEREADQVAEEILDVSLTYDKRWPGRGLQRVASS